LLTETTLPTTAIRIAPSQTRLILFRLPARIATDVSTSCRIRINLKTTGPPSQEFVLYSCIVPLNMKKWSEAIKFTFLDIDGTVQYGNVSFKIMSFLHNHNPVHHHVLFFSAMAKPPSELTSSTSNPPPIIIALHGAGVDADNPAWTDSYRKQEFAWVSILRNATRV
jgi:hypothetical protein